MTLLDRLARAMMDVGVYAGNQRDFEPLAQAALKVVCDALREPSEEMLRDIELGLLPTLASNSGEITAGGVLRALATHLSEGK